MSISCIGQRAVKSAVDYGRLCAIYCVAVLLSPDLGIVCLALPDLTFRVGRLLHWPSAEAIAVQRSAHP